MTLKFILTVLGSLAFGYIFSILQRHFAPETLANGFMDYEKWKEIAPTVFKTTKKDEE